MRWKGQGQQRPGQVGDGNDTQQRTRKSGQENRYRLLTNNCEHFCTWCLYGESRSEQVRHCLVHPLSGLRLAADMLKCWWQSLGEPVCGYAAA